MYSKKNSIATDLSEQVTLSDELKKTSDKSLLVAIEGEEFYKFASDGSTSNLNDTWIGSLDSAAQSINVEASSLTWDSTQVDENSLLDEDEKLLNDIYLPQDYESNIDW